MNSFYKIFILCSVMVFFVDCLGQGLSGEQVLRNKIGEMFIIGFHEDSFHEDGVIVKNIEKYHVGGVILFSGKGLGTEKGGLRNIKNPNQLAALTAGLQSYARRHRLAYEGDLFIGIDQEGGLVSRLSNESGFNQENISARQLGGLNDLSKTYDYSKSMGKYLKGLGINLNFAPVVDLAIEPNNFIYKRERCFSGDPRQVYEQGSAFVRGMHKSGIKTALKHFPGHGSSLGDTHKGIVDVTNTWKGVELEPYKKFISDGYRDMIMISHVVNQNLDRDSRIENMFGEKRPIPATFSKKMVTDLLRNRLGFQGVIITDDMCMKAIVDQYSFREALKYSINAGVDMLILANHERDQTGDAIEIVEELVSSGEISVQRIEDAYNRVLRLKKRRSGMHNDL